MHRSQAYIRFDGDIILRGKYTEGVQVCSVAVFRHSPGKGMENEENVREKTT